MSITDITTWQITALLLTALMTGFAKTGVPAAGILGVTLMASAFAAKESVGILLPMLIAADIVAVIYYRKQVVWKHLISLIPWTLVGIIAGYGLMLVIADTHLKLLIGVLVLLLVFVHIYREYKGSLERAPSVAHSARQWACWRALRQWSATPRAALWPFIYSLEDCRRNSLSELAHGFLLVSTSSKCRSTLALVSYLGIRCLSIS